eukprot:7466235-Lingulodinium_polyedra.AAC.1
MRLSTFVELYEGELSLLLDVPSLKKVMAETCRWSAVEQELQSICSGSTIGYRLLVGFAVGQLLNEKVGEEMDKALSELTTEGQVTSEKLTDCKAQCLRAIEAIQNVEKLQPRREVKVTYRGVPVPIK